MIVLPDGKTILGKGKSNVADYFNYDPNNIIVPGSVYGYYSLVDYFFTYTIAGEIITKKAQFIVSGLKIDSESPEGEIYGENVARKLDIKNKLVKLAINYFSYGLGALYPMPKVRKSLKCKSCAHIYPLEQLATKYKPKYTYSDKGKYRYRCTQKECKNKGLDVEFKLIEEEIDDVSEYNLAVWSPHQLSCIHNSVIDKKMWMYKCDDEMRKLLTDRDHYTICNTPENFLTSIMNNSRVVVPSDRLYVLEYPTMTIKGTPIPPMVMAFQDLYQRQMYQKANRQIAEDILIPLRMLFPIFKGEAGARPMLATFDAATWAKEARKEIEKWMEDKSYVPIMPVEIGTKNIWGEGKLLVLGDHLRANMGDICADLGTPIEFIFGGATWSRQNVSAITLENVLKSLSNKLGDPLGFIESKINKNLPKEQKITLRLDVPRLVDSMGEIAILAQRNAQGKLSDRTFDKAIGRDYDAEQRNLKREAEANKQLIIDAAVNQAMAQTESDKIMLKLEEDKRKSNRVEMLKDSLAQRAIERDQLMFNIQMQEYQYEQQMKMQRESIKLQVQQQKKMLPTQLEGMQAQIDMSEQSQLRIAKKMQKLETMGIKKQMKAQYQAQQEMQAADQKRQMMETQQQAVDMMTPEEKQALSTMPPEKQQEMIGTFIERARIQQVYEALPPEMKKEMEDMNENEKTQMLEQFAAQQEEEQQMDSAVQGDEKLQAEMTKKKMEERLSQEDIQRMAVTYNKLQGSDKESYKNEIMQENTVLYSKVKDLADQLMMQEYLTALLNGDTKMNRYTWAKVVNDNPDMLESLMEEYNSQLTYKTQANAYAYKLVQTYGTPLHDQLIEDLKQNTPVEFKRMVMAEYQNMVAEQTNTKENVYDDNYVAQVVNEINAMSPEERKEVVEAAKVENPVLYSKIILKIKGDNDGPV